MDSTANRMDLNHVDPKPILGSDNSTICQIYTPPETAVSEDLRDHNPSSASEPSSSSIPWPASTFIIRSISSGHLLTLQGGQVVCVESKGWLGFRNSVSGKYLGHNVDGKMISGAENHWGWEYFCARMAPEGGFISVITHKEGLQFVGASWEDGMEKLEKVADVRSAVVWEFIKV